jgi:hypothetical protein
MPLGRRTLVTALVATVVLLGCSADEVPAHDAKYDTPGAFLAVEQPDGTLGLFRVLTSLLMQNGESLLFLTAYAVKPGTYEQAREFSKQRDLGVQRELMSFLASELRKTRYQVVWFRTLTEAERDVLR